MTDPTPATRLDRAWEVLGEATAYISMMGGAIDPAEWNGIERQYRPLIEAAVLEAARERVEAAVPESEEVPALDEHEHTADCECLPIRVVVDQHGHYWRDYGDHWSMCPVSDENVATTPVTEFYRAGEGGDLEERG